MSTASRKAKRLVADLIAKTDDLAFSGSMRPEDRPDVEDAHEEAKAKLLAYIAEIEAATHNP